MCYVDERWIDEDENSGATFLNKYGGVMKIL
jgi:hypothetical protein